MKREAEENASADAKKKEEVEVFNKADGLIFQTEKQLKEFGEKLSADKKAAIETAHTELKTAFEAKDFEAIKTKTEALDAAWMAASEEMYAQGQQAQPGAEQAHANAGDDVQDADFEEVK
jgi:molecular chaperone DnaK